MKGIRRNIFLLLAILVAAIDYSQGQVKAVEYADAPAHAAKWVDSLYQSLTLEQRIGQLYMVPVYPDETGIKTYQQALSLMQTYQIGGIIFMQGNPITAAHWINEFNAKSRVPLFYSIDGEWGLNMRLSNTIRFPKQLTLGAIQQDELIFDMGKEIGRQCNLLGIHINFAPVADINTNPNNPVIHDRSFGEKKEIVAKKALAYAKGLQASDIMPCAKHFPGHGDTDKDSHKDLPTISKSKDMLMHQEFYPFRYLFANGIPACMVGHINMPQQDKTPNSAASISKKITTGILKKELGFHGLIFSDALNMKAVSGQFKPGEADLKAFQAGADVLLFPEDIEKGIKIFMATIDQGKINEADIEKRVKKILAAKYAMGLSQFTTIDTVNLMHRLNTKEGKFIRKSLFEEAITLVHNKGSLLPFKDMSKHKIASIALGVDTLTEFQKTMSHYAPMQHYQIPLSDTDIVRHMKKVKGYNKIVLQLTNLSGTLSSAFGLHKKHIELIQQLSFNKDLILCVGGSPYLLKYFQNQDWIVVGYEDNEITQRAMAHAIFGAIPFKGKLPVSAGKIKSGTGITTDKVCRIKIADSEEISYEASKLGALDTMCQEMIARRVAPGCQLLVAKDGKVIYYKSFGYQTYENEKAVNNSDLYDIASITKIMATTIATMKLVEEKKLDINDSVKKYLELEDSATIGNLLIRDILCHQAGLTPYIPFYARIKPENYASYLSNEPMPGYIKIADSLYLISSFKDSMWLEMTHAKVDPSPKYKYSDVGMYIMQRIIEVVTNTSLDKYLAKTFYKPMGLQCRYNPTYYYDSSNIVPTEEDKVFRKQLLRGYVHDPGAAMYGGVAGHAGLFSNAMDIASMMQMLLNRGTYGGVHYLDSAIIDLFTSYRSEGSRRGYGFDKPAKDLKEDSPCASQASPLTFGHMGFTGTCVWTDPKERLIYVLLTNRIHPTVENKKLIYENWRVRLMEKVYDIVQKIK
jgi:beta-N-acetylhexosaminidase